MPDPRGAKLATAMMQHSAHCCGRTNVLDQDLDAFTEMYPDLQAVFEEVQYLRAREEELEMEIARISD